jgi:hypothetical protein
LIARNAATVSSQESGQRTASNAKGTDLFGSHGKRIGDVADCLSDERQN